MLELLSQNWTLIVALLTVFAVGQVVVPDGGAAAPAGGDPAGEGGDPADEGGGGPDGGDPVGDAAAAAAAAAADGPDADDPEDDWAGLPQDLRDNPKLLRTRHRRLQRQFSQAKPIVERFRDANGQLMSADQVDRVLQRAREMEEFDGFLDENPDVVTTILERRKAGGRAPAAEDVYQDPFANAEALPFDTATETGRFLQATFSRIGRENHELRQQIRQVLAGVGDLRTSDQARTVAQHEQVWRSAVLEGIKELPEESRGIFANSIYRAFQLAKGNGTLARVNVAQLVERELAPFRRAGRARTRTDAAAAQRRATGAQSTPQPQRGRTAPVDPNATTKVGTIRDGKRSFFTRLGMSAPAGGR